MNRESEVSCARGRAQDERAAVSPAAAAGAAAGTTAVSAHWIETQLSWDDTVRAPCPCPAVYQSRPAAGLNSTLE